LFTQCPQCQTVFRVTVAMLRAAQAQVRCGRCAHVFNAVTFLIDQPDGDAPPGAEVGEAPPPDIPAGPNRRASDLPFDPDEYTNQDIPDSALEFDLTVDDLHRVFVKAPAPSLRVKPAEPPVPIPVPTDEDTAEHEIIDIEEASPDEAFTLEGEEVEVTASLAPENPDPDIDADNQTSEFSAAMLQPAANEGDSETDLMRDIEAAFAGDPETRAEFVLPSGTRLKFNDGVAEVDSEPALALAPKRRKVKLLSQRWALASAALGVLLAIQLINFNRDALARSPVFGSAIGTIYRGLGVKLSPHWDLTAYELRQWGAAAEPGDSGTLRVRASVFNSAKHAQPYPLLRLTLHDRFGGRVGLRDLEPREYLHVVPAGNELLGAGQRVDADIAIVDPGKDAVGFEIDVCLRVATNVKCAADQPKEQG
jgi:predicted Zn finger-like uncharacterized protein